MKMKEIKLSYNQSKKVVWNNESIQVKQNGMVLYVSQNSNGSILAKDWAGHVSNVNIKIDECFQ
jgi:hypothetical protein